MREIADKHSERWAAVRRERAFAEAALIEEIDIRETTGGALNKIRQKADEAKLQALREDLIEAEALRDTLADLDELGRELVRWPIANWRASPRPTSGSDLCRHRGARAPPSSGDRAGCDGCY